MAIKGDLGLTHLATMLAEGRARETARTRTPFNIGVDPRVRIPAGDYLFSELREPPKSRLNRVSNHDSDDESEDDAEQAPVAEMLAKVRERLAHRNQAPSSEALEDHAILEYLSSLQARPEQKRQVLLSPPPAPAGLRNSVTPLPHQLSGMALCISAEQTAYKGLILADQPGLGKTLTLLMTIASGMQTGDGCAVVVVPSSCCQQWIDEIDKYFVRGTMPAVLLNDKSVSPSHLHRYKVAVTSYSYVLSEFRRQEKFLVEMEAYDKGYDIECPRRPALTLFSTHWRTDGARAIGKYLILDEVHNIKNTEGRTYAAVRELRQGFKCCFAATGTLLDNTWLDCLAALSLLDGHPFTSVARMRQAFVDSSKKRGRGVKTHNPTAHWLQRLTHLLQAATLCRPLSIIQDGLPPAQKHVVSFPIPAAERKLSNEWFAKWKKGGGNSDEASADADYTERGGPKPDAPPKTWAAMFKAVQYANHPEMVNIMHLARKAVSRNKIDVARDDVDLTEEETTELDTWYQHLRTGLNSRSARIDVIIDLIDRTRDNSPDDAILIIDESVWFLDIVRAAIETMDEPVPVMQYDGRQTPATRHESLERFNSGQGTRVLLASRATGGVGLNLQAANVVIRCAQWWTQSAKDQADARAYRPGQTKTVTIYELRASMISVETHKHTVCKRKYMLNSKIYGAITLFDRDIPQPPWNVK